MLIIRLSQRTTVCPMAKHACTQAVLLVALVLVWLFATPAASWAQAPSVQNGITVGPVTGFPLPRFVSIRPSEANVRVGPGSAYDISWTFLRSGLPVEITAEFGNWRRIRDVDGDEGWIRHDLLTGRRTAVIAPWSGGDPVPARRAPDAAASTRFLLQPGVVGRLDQCDGTWCALESDDPAREWQGYVRQTAIWGAYPDEIFDD